MSGSLSGMSSPYTSPPLSPMFGDRASSPPPRSQGRPGQAMQSLFNAGPLLPPASMGSMLPSFGTFSDDPVNASTPSMQGNRGPPRTHTQTHTHAHAHAHARTRTHTHHARTHARTHAHTHTTPASAAAAAAAAARALRLATLLLAAVPQIWPSRVACVYILHLLRAV